MTTSSCDHSRVSLGYTVPVQVVVQDGQVVRVVVIDEEAERPADGGYTECGDCFTPLPADHPAVLAAQRVAEDPPHGWPSWDVGW